MRIDIVGLPGSGKSTLAREISKKCGVKHIELDRYWFESGGKQGRLTTPNLAEVRELVRTKVIEAIQDDSWVSDGSYLHVQDVISDRSDTIIFLDIPLVTLLLNHAKRVFFQKKIHGELTFWDDIVFFREIVRRYETTSPKLRAFVSEHPEKLVVLHSRKKITSYLNGL